MADMRVIHFNPRKPTILHIESSGCIVNIQSHLHDDQGRAVTRVDVLADRGAGEAWHLPDFEPDGQVRQSIGIRVMELGDDTPKQVENGEQVMNLLRELHDLLLRNDTLVYREDTAAFLAVDRKKSENLCIRLDALLEGK